MSQINSLVNNLTKGRLLSKVAEGLKNKSILYNWANQESDNVGVVAFVLSNMTDEDFTDYMVKGRLDLMMALQKLPDINYEPYYLNFWEPFAKLSRDCENLLGVNVFKKLDILNKLEDLGFNDEELDHLQNLNDCNILKNTNIRIGNSNHKNDVNNLIEYLSAWSAMMNVKELEKVA